MHGRTPPRDDGLKTGARRMLTVLAQRYPARFTRAQLGALSSLTWSGRTFDSYLSTLRTNGLIEEEGRLLWSSKKGLALIGDAPRLPTTPDAMRSMWRDKLKAGALRMYDELVRVYPRFLTREQLCERAALSPGGTFDSYLSSLRFNALIEEKDRAIRAAPVLFNEGITR